jgi:hypothetical protein
VVQAGDWGVGTCFGNTGSGRSVKARADASRGRADGLSWGVPNWVGNDTFYSLENVAYQTRWVQCVQQVTGVTLDYIGLWNERPQPDSGAYIVSLRQSLDASGFGATAIITMDGGFDDVLWGVVESNATVAAAVHGAGLHYPCDKPHPEVAGAGKVFWASEDYSRTPEWSSGASYWGKVLATNYVVVRPAGVVVVVGCTARAAGQPCVGWQLSLCCP